VIAQAETISTVADHTMGEGRRTEMSEEGLMIDPNTAEVEDLIQLPGVGEVMAQRIVDARPFMNSEDMHRVSGLGQATLSQISPLLVFREIAEPERVKPEEDMPSEAELPTDPKVVKVAQERTGISRATTLWLVLGMGVISIALSVILSLSILGGINRTLNYGQHASVRSLVDDTALLRADLEDLNSRLVAVDRRVEAMEGLSGRVMSVESEFLALQEEVRGSLDQMSSVQSKIENLSGDVGALSERVGMFDMFLDGLRQLLLTDVPMEP
jgi:hypothetical protein